MVNNCKLVFNSPEKELCYIICRIDKTFLSILIIFAPNIISYADYTSLYNNCTSPEKYH